MSSKISAVMSLFTAASKVWVGILLYKIDKNVFLCYIICTNKAILALFLSL
jgi:hypothetical protein